MLLVASPVTAWADEAQTEGSVIDEVRQLLQDYHLSNVSDEQLIDAAIDGMIESLGDPYTSYMTDDEWHEYQDSIEQNIVGIGVRLSEDDNGVYAVDVFPDSPAYEAGILRGDYIIAINGRSALDKSTSEIVAMIAGEEHTDVKVTIFRSGSAMTFQMTRRSLNIPNVENKWLKDDGIGYIKLHTFSTDADELFEEYMTKMKVSGLQGLVIDVRSNPGGYLDTVGYIVGEFLQDGNLMYTRDKDGFESPITIMNGYKVDVPVAILIDEHSASASEILAGALQDHGLATVIGVRSFGKGSVQSLLFLTSGGVLKTTVQEYLTPNRLPVDGVGITPDIEVQGSVPQLLTAFREVGLTALTIQANSRELLINGVNFSDRLPFIHQDDSVYVHSRVLGALMGMQVTWDPVNGQVVFVGDAGQYTFPVQSPDVIQQTGMTLIELSSFAKQAQGFSWGYDEGELTMSIQ